ncbi:hypothetical protein QBC47DRAFT_389526 [Echria macrotheca]|uniref:Postreplication repair E3 ubiquitin-protein ligase RAD18 n=1 Tax=Echria macrotheca TaxID=438768 RepID=A0AAJ0F672_9PEZI|nr:hypothetical protein QBC47DRAFT_389526 [Echria macrotheca]
MEVLDEAFEVSDSTDWLGTPLAGLVAVEQSFRCHVCKDFYNSPMLTSCNHTFCSICIRRCLNADGKCPLCRASDQESKLRGNWALREAVDAFVSARDGMLRFARTPVVTASPSSPKRKAAELDSPETAMQENKRPRMSTRSSKTRAAQAAAQMAQEEIDDSEESDGDDFEPDDGLVACPICLSRMKPWMVDKHLDTTCPGSPQPDQASTSTGPNHRSIASRSAPSPFPPPSPSKTKPPDRLPAVAYAMLKDAALRKKLTDLGLSAAGPRQILERRHQEWVTMWNANCDSARPKKRAELLRDLDVWERTVGGRAPTMSRALNMGAQIRDKEFDGAAWAAKHDTSFKDLIANARRSRAQAERKAGGDEGVGESANSNPDPSGLAGPPTQQQTEVFDLQSGSPASRPSQPGPPEYGNGVEGLPGTDNGDRATALIPELNPFALHSQ